MHALSVLARPPCPQRSFRRKTGAGGLLRELNPGPLAPEARIMPLDQAASCASMIQIRRRRGQDGGSGLLGDGHHGPTIAVAVRRQSDVEPTDHPSTHTRVFPTVHLDNPGFSRAFLVFCLIPVARALRLFPRVCLLVPVESLSGSVEGSVVAFPICIPDYCCVCVCDVIPPMNSFLVSFRVPCGSPVFQFSVYSWCALILPIICSHVCVWRFARFRL